MGKENKTLQKKELSHLSKHSVAVQTIEWPKKKD